MQMLQLSAEAYWGVIAHAQAAVPLEACGLLAAVQGKDLVSEFFPMRNAAESAQLYRLDDAEYLQVEQIADARKLRLVAVMHSHTHTTAYPSPTDVRDASAFDPFGALLYVIVSLKHVDPVLRCYRIVGGQISEVSVEVQW
ncbi:MAG: M67 family metallopeptidase [Acidimicrobiia bacterium]|nr:M67 family metallopeptidase [Acidimicrobiia bacterium]MYC57442.1 M67 family metallopeptidase [Acidimicrobiia bacterium]MYG93737.1 M67 family metallopeptidase [Acidimicrobiia bacterium]MYI30661.1 M67 family metallopeptidase [Acidimicrobiia bacterium]